MDILEPVDLILSDSLINGSDVHLIAYNIRMPNLEMEQEQEVYNPKKYPSKAVHIRIQPSEQYDIHIFLDTQSKMWDSSVNGNMKLSPNQMEQFFKTKFFDKVYNRVKKDWPLSDPFYRQLCDAITNKKLNICAPDNNLVDEGGEFRKSNIDKNRSREKNAAGVQTRTNSGRVIVTFSDFGVEKKDQAKYYCWPKIGSEMKWSQWNIADKVYDEEKANPKFVSMRFHHAGYEYGLNLSLRPEIDKNRGWFAWNNDLEPHVQWTTPIETNQMFDLSIVQQFLSAAKKRIKKYLDIPTEEIYKQINNPEKITMDQIDATKKLIRQNLPLVIKPQADTYIY